MSGKGVRSNLRRCICLLLFFVFDNRVVGLDFRDVAVTGSTLTKVADDSSRNLSLIRRGHFAMHVMRGIVALDARRQIGLLTEIA